jgi:hypothetical protein
MRARAATERIVAGAAAMFDHISGGHSRQVKVYRLPDMAMLRTWVIFEPKGIGADDAADMWRELGDGGYLLEMIAGNQTVRLVVDRHGDQVEQTIVSDDELAGLLLAVADLQGPAN